MTRPALTPLDATWCRLLDAVAALHELAAVVRAAGAPAGAPGSGGPSARRGMRLTLTSAPTVEAEGVTVVTGASRLVVRLARPAAQLRLAAVVSLDEARRRRERAA